MTTLKQKMDEWWALKFQLCETPHGGDFVEVMQSLREAVDKLKFYSEDWDKGTYAKDWLKKWGWDE